MKSISLYILFLFLTIVLTSSFTKNHNTLNTFSDEINFPLLNLKNKKVEDKIYKCLIDSINNHFFFEDIIPAKNRKEIIDRFKSDKEASFYLTHKLSLSKNTISINLHYEIAHSNGYDSWGEQFVFNAKTGERISIKEIITKQNEFETIFKSKQKKYIEKSKLEIEEILKLDDPNAKYEETNNPQLEYCFSDYEYNFEIEKDSFFIYPHCGFPRVIRNMEPYEPIKLSKKELNHILKKEYK
jgi:hypothetical protein